MKRQELKEQFEQMEEFGFPSTLAQSAINEKSAVVIPDLAQSDASSDSESATLLKIRSALCVPIMVENEGSGGSDGVNNIFNVIFLN